jgi:hypothetical protein
MKIRFNSLLEQVREYDQKFQNLQASHHFTFCLLFPRELPSNRVVLLGYNPSESPHDWSKTSGQRAEESFLSNFNGTSASNSSKKWHSNIDFYLPNSDIMFTEFIFWSSKNISQLEHRIGPIIDKNPHVKFCVSINRELIEIYDPNLIIVTGLALEKLVSNNFGLAKKQDIFSQSKKRLAIIYQEEGGKDRKWLFCRHWTGSFGFSNADKSELKDLIYELSATS